MPIRHPLSAEKLRSPDRFCAQVIDARTGLPNLLTSMMAQLQTLSRAETRATEVPGRQIVEVLAIALDDSAPGTKA